MGKTYTLQIEVTGKDRASKPLGSVTSALGRMKEIAGGIIAAKLISGIATQIYNLGKESIMAASRVEELDVVIGVISKANKVSEEGMRSAVKTLQDYGIANAEAQSAVIQFARYQIDLADATKIARVAQDAAVLSQTDSSEALARIMHGITTQNSLVLRNAGLNIMASDAMDKYAASLGTTTAELTSQQRIQAMVNAVQEEGVKIQGAYEAAMDTAGKKLRSYKRYWNELAIAIGGNLKEAFHDLVFAGADVFSILRMLIEEGGVLETIFGSLGVINPFSGLLESTGKIKELLEHFQKFSSNELGVSGMDAFRNSIDAVFGEETVAKFDNILDGFEKVGEYIDIAKAKFSELKDVAQPSIEWLKINAPLAFQYIKDKAEIAFAWLKENVPPAIDAIKEAFEKAQPVFDWIKENWDSIAVGAGAFILVFFAIPAVIAAVGAAFTTVATVIGGAFALITSPLFLIAAAVALLAVAWHNNWGDIQGKTTTAIDWIKSKIDIGLSKVNEFWEKYGFEILASVEGMWQTVKEVWQSWLDVIHDFQAVWIAAQEGNWEEFGKKLKDLFESFGKAISDTINSWWSLMGISLRKLGDRIKEYFKNIDWKSVGADIMQGIADGLMSKVKKSIEAARAIYDGFRGFFDINSPARMPRMKIGIPIGQGIMLGAQDAINKAKLSIPQTSSPAKMLAPSGSNRFGNGTSSQGDQTFNIHIESNDPDEVYDVLMRKLRSQGLKF